MNNKSTILTWAGTALICLATTSPAWAQIEIPSDYYGGILYKRFSATGQSQLWTSNANEGLCTVQFYDVNFSPIKSFTIAGTMSNNNYTYKTEQRVTIPNGYNDEIWYERTESLEGWIERYLWEYGDTAQVTDDVLLAIATEYAAERGADKVTQDGNVYTFVPSEIRDPENEDERVDYTKCIYTKGSREIVYQEVSRTISYIYTDEWAVIEEGRYTAAYSYYDYFEYGWVFNDYDSYPGSYETPFTQTLFNTDDKYEYIRPVYKAATVPDTVDYNWEWIYNADDDTEVRILTERQLRWYDYEFSHYEVVSEDGTVLYSIPVSYKYADLNVCAFGGKNYIRCYDNDFIKFYEIDAKASSIKEVRSLETRMFPTVARRSESITIETTATGGKREVVITAMDGRIMGRQAIPAGESRVQVRAARLASGTYDFSVYADGKRVDNGKIIIR